MCVMCVCEYCHLARGTVLSGGSVFKIQINILKVHNARYHNPEGSKFQNNQVNNNRQILLSSFGSYSADVALTPS